MKKNRNSFFAENNAYFQSSPNNMPNQFGMNNSYYTTNQIPMSPNEIETRIAKIERQINRLEHRINTLENKNSYKSTEDIETINNNMYII